MVNSKGKRPDYCSEVADELLCEFYLRFTNTIYQKEERSAQSTLLHSSNSGLTKRPLPPVGPLLCYFYLDGAGAGAWILTSIFVVRPPNNRPLKINAKARSRITKITRTATTPALPPPSSPLSPISRLLLLSRGNW